MAQHDLEDNQQAMLPDSAKPLKTRTEKVLRKILKSTGNLSNHLPTGTLLAFQLLVPYTTQNGRCTNSLERNLTISLIAVLAFVCFLLCFTDSVRDSRGKVRHGLITARGIWIIDGSKTKLPSEVQEKYKLKAIDFFHAFLTVLVLGTVVFFTANVDYCFFPNQTIVEEGVLLLVPIVVGVACACLFILWPSKRHGIGFPLSKQ